MNILDRDPRSFGQGVELDESTHTWTIDGQKAPGITAILEHASIKPVYPESNKRDLGTIIHKGVEWSLQPDFDFDEFKRLYPEAVGAVESGRKALGYFNVTPGWVEIPVCHRRLFYCTAIDAIGMRDGRLQICNWKSGQEEAWHAIQSAGEARAFLGDFYTSMIEADRVSVYLADDGSFDPAQCVRVHDDRKDFEVWECAAVLSEWKQMNGYARPKAPPMRKVEEKPLILEASSLFEAGADGSLPGKLFG